jgi:hypothetical protein
MILLNDNQKSYIMKNSKHPKEVIHMIQTKKHFNENMTLQECIDTALLLIEEQSFHWYDFVRDDD